MLENLFSKIQYGLPQNAGHHSSIYIAHQTSSFPLKKKSPFRNLQHFISFLELDLRPFDFMGAWTGFLVVVLYKQVILRTTCSGWHIKGTQPQRGQQTELVVHFHHGQPNSWT